MKINHTNTYTKLTPEPRNNKPEKIIVHHSGGTDANPLADTSEHTAKGIELWHVGKGWDGLGYHYVIHKDGAIWAGRPEHRNGAHTVNHNSTSIGICLTGNFDATLPTRAQEESLKWLIKDVAQRNKIALTEIFPHRKFANKTCYGNKLSDTWARDLVMNDVLPSVNTEQHICEPSLKTATIKELVEELIIKINQVK